MKQSLRVAVIGCGAISGNHFAAIREAGQELVALCDILPSRTRGAIQKYALGELPCFTDYIEMLDTVKPDAVHICTPHYLHAPMCIAAMERDIHVLCEKPLCISLEQLKELREAARRSRSQVGVCLQNRYEPNMRRLYEMSREGVSAACGYVTWKRDAAYYGSGTWRGTWDQEGGGVMINQALHTLDLMQWICGMPTRVSARTFTDHLAGVIEVEDTATARFEGEGNVFTFFATVAAGGDFPVSIQARLATGELMQVENYQFTCNYEPLPSASQGAVLGKSVWGMGHKWLIADFYDHIEKGTHFPIDLEEASKVVRMILAMYASNGALVDIPE